MVNLIESLMFRGRHANIVTITMARIPDVFTVIIFDGKLDQDPSKWTALHQTSGPTLQSCHDRLYDCKMSEDDLYYAERVSMQPYNRGKIKWVRFGYADSMVDVNCAGRCDPTGKETPCFSHPDFAAAHRALHKEAALQRLYARRMAFMRVGQLLAVSKNCDLYFGS